MDTIRLPFRLISRWNRAPVSGSFLAGNTPSGQAHFSLDKAGPCRLLILSLVLATGYRLVKIAPRVSKRPERIAKQARARIARLRERLGAIEYLCSGTLIERRKRCGKPGCRCATDPAARHGPYYEWGHMHEGRLVHKTVSERQAAVLRLAIGNYRKVRKLLREWEVETERLIESEDYSEK